VVFKIEHHAVPSKFLLICINDAGRELSGAPVGVIRPGAVGSSCSVSCAAMYPSVDACNASRCQRAPNSGISTVKGYAQVSTVFSRQASEAESRRAFLAQWPNCSDNQCDR
jgi:hypothetical protein